MNPILFALIKLALFSVYTVVWFVFAILYTILVYYGLNSSGGATAVISLAVLGYLSAILYVYADVKQEKYLSGQFEPWRTVGTYVSFIISLVCAVLSYIVGLALIIVGGVLGWAEMIVVGGACFLFGVVLTIFAISQLVTPDYIKTLRASPVTTNVLTSLVYVFAAVVTIPHIISVIVVGLNFNGLGYQPSYWLYSVLIAILFEAVLVKPFIFMVDVMGMGSLYKFFEIMFYGRIWTAPTPTEVYGVPTQSFTNFGRKGTKGAIKATGQATFEKGFEEEEFGGLGPVEEPEAVPVVVPVIENNEENSVVATHQEETHQQTRQSGRKSVFVEEEETGPREHVQSNEDAPVEPTKGEESKTILQWSISKKCFK